MNVATYTNEGLIAGILGVPSVEEITGTLAIMGWAGAVECDDEVTANPGHYYIADVDDESLIRIELRQEMTLVLDGLILSGVPAGATVTIEGAEYLADGTDIELSATHSGTFLVGVSLFPWRDASVEVVIEDPA